MADTNRTRKRTRRRKGAGKRSADSRWMDLDLQYLTPTPTDRHDWERNREHTWTQWSDMTEEERPVGSKKAPLAAIVLDWKGHFGPVFDMRGRRRTLTTEHLEEYADLAGPGCTEWLEAATEIFIGDTDQ